MSHAELFPELTDYIIDFLHDEKHSLAACSLVCRTWRTSSQYHLLQTVVIRGHCNFKRFLSSFLPQRNSSVSNVHTARACSFVRVLELRPGRDLDRFRAIGDKIVVSSADISNILASLHSLHTLSLRYAVMEISATTEQVQPLNVTPKAMRRLSICSCKASGTSSGQLGGIVVPSNPFPRPLDIREWMLMRHMFASVDELDFDSDIVDPPLSEGALNEWFDLAARSKPLYLSRLNFGQYSRGQSLLIEDLNRSGSGQTIHEISISINQWDTFISLGRLLGGQHVSLSTLSLSVLPIYSIKKSLPTESSPTIPLDLGSCTSLGSLNISLRLDTDRLQDNISYWKMIVGIISTVCTTSLRHLALHISLGGPDRYAIEEMIIGLEWQHLDDTLAKFELLSSLQLYFIQDYHIKDEQLLIQVQDTAKQTLKSTRKREGLLEFPADVLQ